MAAASHLTYKPPASTASAADDSHAHLLDIEAAVQHKLKEQAYQPPALASVGIPLPLKRAKSLSRAWFGAGSTAEMLVEEAIKFTQLAGKFMPMVGLFFLLAFNNTILDSLKDTLVITAAGGGAQVIPYLTVYAVLPSSLLFLLLYSIASQHLPRAALFNAIVAVFMGFFALFGAVLYPCHSSLHPHAFADWAAKGLPSGLDGLVGMVRNWTFTMFFCMSELWGDVCLGLLFWGLANDTTSLSDAPTLYPLFGIGANVAQSLAGVVLKLFSGSEVVPGSFKFEIQAMMGIVMIFSVAALALHAWINHRDQQTKAEEEERLRLHSDEVSSAMAIDDIDYTSALDQAAESHTGTSGATASHGWSFGGPGSRQADVSTPATWSGSSSRASTSSGGSLDGDASSSSSSSSSGDSLGSLSSASLSSYDLDDHGRRKRRSKKRSEKKTKQGLNIIFKVLANSVPIRCLAIMSLAQGLCTNLMEFAWKSHISMMYPRPAEFTAFLGDVSTLQGLFTGVLMVLSPAMFKALGWKGVAATTPNILLWGGGAFFAACLAFQHLFAAVYTGAVAATPLAVETAALWLKALVFGGAVLYVFSKSAKFSLFKPAEEMVYISLDEEGRTKGKAAIDVVGSQTGKSAGSVLQQVLLVVSGGAIAGSLPIMFGVYFIFVHNWLRSVNVLSDVNNYGHESSIHQEEEEEEAHEVGLAAPQLSGSAGVVTGSSAA